MSRTYLLSGWIWAVVAIAPCCAEEPMKIGQRKQLVVDDYVIARRESVTRELGTVTKANGGQPVMEQDRFCERRDGGFALYMSTIYDRDRFRMWYFCKSDLVGYAESEDGFAWKKGFSFLRAHGFSWFRDEHETDPAQRYKGVGHLGQVCACLMYSADGFRWTPYNDGKPVTGRAADTHNDIIWDPMKERYLLFTRTDFGTGGGAGEWRGTRVMEHTGGNDLLKHPTDWKTICEWKFDREGPEEKARRQIYAFTDFIYEGVHIGLMKVYEYPADGERFKPDFETRHEKDVMNCYIGTSRDAVNWDLSWVYADKPFIPRGPAGAFDKDMIWVDASVITHDDKHWIYYAGCNERHACPERQSGVGLVTLRLDGFVALAAGAQPGMMETKPFVLEGDGLEINADARGGILRVDVMDKDGAVLSEGVVLKDVDGLRLVPEWTGRKDLADLKGRTVRLRFLMTNAKLYAFQICQ